MLYNRLHLAQQAVQYSIHGGISGISLDAAMRKINIFLLLISMYFLYNAILAVCLPLLALTALFRAKYRGRTLKRLGLTLKSSPALQGPVIWIHALSVGEVTSALPLVKAVHAQIRPVRIVFTATTRSGKELADNLISPHADIILSSPLDFRFAVRRYLAAIQPDIFILVETDFWPNWLDLLHQQGVPLLLVNGRISVKSFAAYRRFAFFFKPMFCCFSLLSMQTANDRERLLELGFPPERVLVLGNLKYDLSVKTAPPDLGLTKEQHIWVCGSTHPGEEEFIFAAFKAIGIADNIFLIIAPRQISRGAELVRLAQRYGFTADLRSSGSRRAESRILILDIIGELAGCYALARLAFIGGSLVSEGGHNPIEAAAQGVPVLFGQHMEDFAEIAADLMACGGAKMVTAESLAVAVTALLADEVLHAKMSKAAQTLVAQQRGGAERHVQAISTLLGLSRQQGADCQSKSRNEQDSQQ
ncbi:3-deoxy-D-manno-octulosonic acid transferase [Desulfobulbus sp. F4]|nr:3-deoxy-D-manno-octulosonic acid transferase [Desulfobulbus sp. F4]